MFGSNLSGHHLGGAARTAYTLSLCCMGARSGLHRTNYAIPTMHGGIDIQPYVEEFIRFAEKNPNLKFFNMLGCGIAGLKIKKLTAFKKFTSEKYFYRKRF